MALTIDVNPPEGGILISGSADEIDDLILVMREALDDGVSEGSLLTDDGVESVRVVALP